MTKNFKTRQMLNSTLFLALFAILSACSSAPEDAENGAAPEGTETAQTTPATDAVPGDATVADATQTPEAKAAADATAATTPTNDPSLDAPATTSAPTDTPVASTESTPPAATQPAPVTNEDLAKAEVPPPPAAEPAAPAPSEPTTTASTEVPAAPTEEVATTTPTSTPETGDSQSYKVKSGDTLMKIAFEQYGDLYHWREIYTSNQSVIQDPNHVPPGTVLQLGSLGGGRRPGSVKIDHNGEEYLIKVGDTLGTISNDVYGTNQKWKTLWENNRQLIKDPNRIYAGFYLYYVPDQEKHASN